MDLQPSGGNEPGTNVGQVAAGEWLKYTVNVLAAGQYSLELRVAATSTGRHVDVLMDASLLADNWTVPNTGNYQSYQSMTRDGHAGRRACRCCRCCSTPAR